MKLDILVIASHPDDAELGCAGTILKHISLGKKVGILDLTRGELGTRGTAKMREEEAAFSAKVLGVSVRENANLPDGFFRNDPDSQQKVIQIIRRYKPEIVLANATYDRHPDHGRGAELIYEASFYSGLMRIKTADAGVDQEAWRPKALYHFIQSQFLKPDFIVDVSDFWEKKMESVRAFKSQFHDPASNEPETYISNSGFLRMIESRGIELGHAIGVRYGEGFTVRRTPGVNNLFDIL
jgi:N-acetylglucosamine malate deacetylase 1